VVEESEIAEVLNSEKTLEEKCHYLIEAAKQNGAPDNVTVLLIQLV
jgi:serine/threonine protein phosphatase PrpC